MCKRVCSGVSRALWPPWTVAHQAPLSLGYSRQECRSGLPFSSPGDLLDPGTKHPSLASPALQTDSLPLSYLGNQKQLYANWQKEKKKLIFFFNDISFGISWWLLNWQVSTWQESRRCGFWSQLGVFQQCGLEKVLRPLRAWLLMDKKGTTFQDSDGYGCSHLSQNCCDYYYFYLQKLDSLKSHAAAAAKSLQLCQTLCDPTDSNPPASPVPGILQARTLEWVQHMQSLIFQKVLYSYYCSKCNIW